jgi:hypothetical protein
MNQFASNAVKNRAQIARPTLQFGGLRWDESEAEIIILNVAPTFPPFAEIKLVKSLIADDIAEQRADSGPSLSGSPRSRKLGNPLAIRCALPKYPAPLGSVYRSWLVPRDHPRALLVQPRPGAGVTRCAAHQEPGYEPHRQQDDDRDGPA